MAIDSSLEVRRAILTLLKGDPGVTAIVPKLRIYPQIAPAGVTWPFIIYGAPSAIPSRATCLDGSEIVVAVHGFAAPRKNGSGKVIETAEDHAYRLGKAIAAALDSRRVDIPQGHAKIQWTGSQLLIDGGEADAFHTVQNLRIRALTV